MTYRRSVFFISRDVLFFEHLFPFSYVPSSEMQPIVDAFFDNHVLPCVLSDVAAQMSSLLAHDDVVTSSVLVVAVSDFVPRTSESDDDAATTRVPAATDADFFLSNLADTPVLESNNDDAFDLIDTQQTTHQTILLMFFIAPVPLLMCLLLLLILLDVPADILTHLHTQ